MHEWGGALERLVCRRSCGDRRGGCVTVQVVEDIEVEERYVLGGDGSSGGRGREYKVAMRFADPAKFPPEANITYEEVPPLSIATLYSLPSVTYLIATSMHKRILKLSSLQGI
jgi:hypothetical protein